MIIYLFCFDVKFLINFSCTKHDDFSYWDIILAQSDLFIIILIIYMYCIVPQLISSHLSYYVSCFVQLELCYTSET